MNMMTDEEIYDLLSDYSDIEAMSVIDTAEFEFNPAFRQFCEDNECGHYNENYSCPPYCGTPDEMKAKALAFRKALVIQTKWEVWDAMNMVQVEPCKGKHNRISLEIIEKLRPLLGEMNAMFAGPCSQCEKCVMQKGVKCVKDYKIYSCASAYCLNVAAMCEKTGMDYFGDVNHVSFFSVFLFDKK